MTVCDHHGCMSLRVFGRRKRFKFKASETQVHNNGFQLRSNIGAVSSLLLVFNAHVKVHVSSMAVLGHKRGKVMNLVTN
jgi:hypothetical protein